MSNQNTKWVEVEVIMFRRFMVEVPDSIEDAEDYADREVFENALTNKEQHSVTGTFAYLVTDAEYLERQKEFCDVINVY